MWPRLPTLVHSAYAFRPVPTVRRIPVPTPWPGSLLALRISGDLGPHTWFQTKRNQTVAYPRTSPKEPPSAAQVAHRARFAAAVSNWLAADQSVRAAYERASLATSLMMTGHNVWVHLSFSQSESLRLTLQRQSGENLPMPTPV